jgi:hypothetical protein
VGQSLLSVQRAPPSLALTTSVAAPPSTAGSSARIATGPQPDTITPKTTAHEKLFVRFMPHRAPALAHRLTKSCCEMGAHEKHQVWHTAAHRPLRSAIDRTA